MAIGTGADGELCSVLDDVVGRAGLWAVLSSLQLQRVPEQLSVVIKVDLGPHGLPGPSARCAVSTAAAAVERLVDLLHDRGYVDIRLLVAGDNGLGRADEVGYAYVTDDGREYDIREVSEDLRADALPANSVLAGAKVSGAWVDADVRIVFAKSTTDGDDFFTLCASSLRELVVDDRVAKLEETDVPAELLLSLPPHFALIDAWQSSDGRDGRGQPQTNDTRTIVASENVLLCDMVTAFRMGLDPHASRCNARALDAVGLPQSYRTDGELQPFADFERPDPLYVQSRRFGGVGLDIADRMERLVHRLGHAREQDTQGGASALGDAMTYWSRVGFGFGVGAVRSARDAYSTLFDKDELPRRQVGLGINPADFAASEYEAAAPYLERLEALASQAARDDSGLQWCYLDGSVLLQYTRTIAVPFADFSSAVEVSRSVQVMNDYLGGASVVVQRDAAGRVTHQATRTIYLPQPNFQVLFGGKPIDVSKLEHSRYDERQHKVYWRTVKSLNDSAKYDDGSVGFVDVGDEGTQITIVARQQFGLPLFWQAVHIDLQAAFKRAIVEHAYRDYFARTIANFEATYEGREVRAGRSGNEQETGGDRLRGARDRAAEWVGHDGRMAGAARAALGVQARRPVLTDDDGYKHFEPSARRDSEPPRRPPIANGVGDFLRDLSDAVRKDWPGVADAPRTKRRGPR